MNTVVALAVADSRVDSSRVWAAGKLLGSSVAWHVLRANRTLRGDVLLTPVCSQIESAGAAPVAILDYYYEDVSAETRPLVFALGSPQGYKELELSPISACHQRPSGICT